MVMNDLNAVVSSLAIDPTSFSCYGVPHGSSSGSTNTSTSLMGSIPNINMNMNMNMNMHIHDMNHNTHMENTHRI